tara:strand:+ start:399 stop:2159 length:1761 start_codon:yes stop_codon:yes gene_type:complete
MALKEQMDMFDDGGLMQEGGTVDPISGNDVPVGSTQEEVRDDIPAQLSEGEFVFPADVVRYWGLDRLMKMRQEAKAGLKMMDAMGQMGNSEEAVMPDDIPFDVSDLDMEDDGMLEYAEGGVVNAQVGAFMQPQQQYGISGYQQSQFGNFQQPTMMPQPTQPLQPTSMQPLQPTGMRPLQTSGTPISTTKVGGLPGQAGMGFDVGPPDEYKTYRNEAGQEIQVPFKNGKVHPAFTVPSGYTLVTGTAETKPEEPKVDTDLRADQQSDGDDGPQIDPITQGDKGQFSTTDMRGIGYDRSKISKESGLLDELNQIAKSQAQDVGSVAAAAFGAGPGLAIKEAGMRVASELGVGKFKETKGVNSRREFLTSQKVTMDALLSGLNATYGGTRSAFQDSKNKFTSAGQRLHELSPEVQRSLAGELKANREALSKSLEGKTAADLRAEINNVQEGLGKDIAELDLSKTYNDGKSEREKTYGQLFAEARATKAARDKLAAQYGLNAKGKSLSQIRQEAEKAEQDRRAKEAAQYASSIYDTSDDDGPQIGGGSVSRDVREAVAEAGGYTGGGKYGGFAKGGLAQQMKQSGLASKK